MPSRAPPTSGSAHGRRSRQARTGSRSRRGTFPSRTRSAVTTSRRSCSARRSSPPRPPLRAQYSTKPSSWRSHERACSASPGSARPRPERATPESAAAASTFRCDVCPGSLDSIAMAPSSTWRQASSRAARVPAAATREAPQSPSSIAASSSGSSRAAQSVTRPVARASSCGPTCGDGSSRRPSCEPHPRARFRRPGRAPRSRPTLESASSVSGQAPVEETRAVRRSTDVVRTCAHDDAETGAAPTSIARTRSAHQALLPRET